MAKEKLVTLHVRVQDKHKKYFVSQSKKQKVSIGQAVRNGIDTLISVTK